MVREDSESMVLAGYLVSSHNALQDNMTPLEWAEENGREDTVAQLRADPRVAAALVAAGKE